jgi:hypothetical protein
VALDLAWPPAMNPRSRAIHGRFVGLRAAGLSKLRARNTRASCRVVAYEEYMLAVIGNVIAGLGVFSLFTATLRLSKPAQRS